ncbi:MAG: GNAT family N-acetyltransferase [Parashewanella sp.]
MDIQIRHSHESDIPQIFELYQQQSIYTNTLQLPFPSIEKWRKKLTEFSDVGYSLVAEVDGEIVGQLSIAVKQNPRQKHVATLGMGVSEHVRGKGVGSKLLTSAMKLAQDWLAIKRIEIEVYTDNEAAIALYKNCGFEVEGEAKYYAFRNGEYVNAYYMAAVI